MRKQKALALDDPSIKTPKIPKYAIPIISTSQPLPQSIDSTRIYNPEFKSLDELMQVWNHAKEKNITVSHAQMRITEIKSQLVPANLEIEKLQENIYKERVEQGKMTRYIEEKCGSRNTIIEKQNIAHNLTMKIREHTNELIDMLEQCEKDRQRLTNLWNDAALKQQAVMEILTQKSNDQVSKKVSGLKDQLEIKCKESLSYKTTCEQFEQEIKYKNQLRCKKNHKIEESEVIINENEKKYNEKNVQISETIKERELYLKAEHEAKDEFEKVINENSANHTELLIKYNALELLDSECEGQIKYLNSRELELENKNMLLNKELDKMNNIHFSSMSNKDLEVSEYRKQLQDLTYKKTEANDKIAESISNVQELSKTVAKLVEENEELGNLLENKDDEMMHNRKNSNAVLEDNKNLNDKIQAQKAELIDVEKQISDRKNDFHTREAKRDEIAKKEVELGTELALNEQQVSQTCEELVKLVENTENKEIQSSKQEEGYKNEVKELDDIIIREIKSKHDLDREIERVKSEFNKKIQDATHSSKKCNLLGHEKKIKELNIKIDIMNKNLSNDKLKQQQEINRRNVTQTKKIEKYENGMKKLESKYDNLKKELTNIQEKNEGIMSEVKKSEALSRAKKSKQETISTIPTPKPILKSFGKDSPFKVQKVKFDLGSQFDLGEIDVSEMFEEAHRRYTASGSNTKLDRTKIKASSTVEEPDTTAPIIADSQSSQASQPTQTRKFFKEPRAQKKFIFHSGKRYL